MTSGLKECYHEIIFEIFQCMPHTLLAVIPNLAQELVVGLLALFCEIQSFCFMLSRLLTC